ncbi:fibronectin type III domain-containing protein, partial [Nocardioides sp. Bht2]|uniref:fibronectin type III domain-containing protein n=1 Tax=Nocardioides sp. Bht2 TaxID=3392297 RepID=UPI0039B5C740
TGVTATAGNGQATVSFTAPVSDGGSAITSYTVAADPGTATRTCDASPCTVTGLSNGTAYTFTVVATNEAGDSVVSDPSAAVTPITKPGAPTGVTATAGNGQATVSFTAPVSDGGSAITSYTVAADPGTATKTCDASPCTVTGLSNGTAYTFTVVATNAEGDSDPSARSASVTPARVPDAPSAVVAVAGDRRATVSFVPPLDNGGAPITSFTVTTRPGGISTVCAASPCAITGLSNGTAYRFVVRATNVHGDSFESAPSAAVRPAAPVVHWFRDPLSSKQRQKLAPVPGDPKRATGRMRSTRATYRTFNGTLAVPVSSVRGNQLGAGQGVQLTGLFRFDSAKLTPSGRRQLLVVARSLKNVRALTCEGYADYAGSLRRERVLSAQRARAACAVLKKKQEKVKVRAVGYGPLRPVQIGGTPHQRVDNRRIALLIRR